MKEVATPEHALQYAMSMAVRESWQSDDHLRVLRKCLQRNNCLIKLEDVSQLARKLFYLVACLLSNRAWSMAVRHFLPPERYAGLLQPSHKEETCKLIKKEHSSLLEFESHVTVSAKTGHNGRAHRSIKLKLKDDLKLAVSPPSRLIMGAMQAQGYKLPDPAHELQGQFVTAPERLLKAMLKYFPDNKIVEDAHNYIPKDAKGNPNQKQTNLHTQDVVECSNVLEFRKICHSVAIDKESFMNERVQKKRTIQKDGRFEAHGLLLKPEWQQLVGNKTWATYNEVSLEKATAAWTWLQYFQATGTGHNGNKWHGIEFGVFAELAHKHCVLWRNESATPVFCFVWGVLRGEHWRGLFQGSNQDAVETHDVQHYCLGPTQQCLWVYLDDPSEWGIIHGVSPEWHDRRICLSVQKSHRKNLMRQVLTGPRPDSSSKILI